MLGKMKFGMNKMKKELEKMKGGKKDKKDDSSDYETDSEDGSYEAEEREEGPVHRALLIGINYPGTDAELKGCINDVENVQQYLEETHPDFTEILVLTYVHIFLILK
jgi:hypothetical protein